MTTLLGSIPPTSLLPYFVVAVPTVLRAQPVTVAGLAAWQARRVARTMLEHLAANVSTSALASECGLSRGHFSRAFKATFGLPPHCWRQRQRIALAKTLLAERKHPLADIAAHCGFSDQAHFTRVFKVSTGMTPMAWRRQGAMPSLASSGQDAQQFVATPCR